MEIDGWLFSCEECGVRARSTEVSEMTQRLKAAASDAKSGAKNARWGFCKLSRPWRAWILTIAGLLVLCWPATSPGQSVREFAREGFAANERREYHSAVRSFTEALKQRQSPPEQRGLLLYGRGVAYEALGRRDLALGDLDAAIALLPDFSNAYVYRALAWSGRRQFAKARDDLLQALRLNPSSALIYNNLGSVYERMGEVDLAIENYGAAIRLDPGYAQAFYNRAHAYIARQDYMAAIADYDRTIALKGDFADAHSNRGGMHLLLGDMDNAIKDFDAAIRLNGNDPIFWSNRASAYFTLGRFKDALADFDRAQIINPGNAATYLGRGRVRLYSGAILEAIDDFQIATRLTPTSAHPAIWLHIARAHQGSRDREELKRNAGRVDRSRWPASVVDFYLGNLDADAARKDAGREPTADAARRLCELDFYIGEFLLHSKEDAKGRKILEEVVDRCRPANVISAAAKAELGGK
jgi:tetratricopeptide (TPR) repeat protein